MSQLDARGTAQRLQEIEEVLNALLSAYDSDRKYLKTIRKAYRRLDQLKALPPDDVDSQMIIELEELLQGGNISKPNVPAEEATLHERGVAYYEKFKRWGDLDDLERAITSWQRVVDLTLDSHPNLPACLSNLGVAFLSRFERLGSLADLEAAISRNQRAVNLTPDNNSSKPGRLSNLGNALEKRFQRCGSIADLEEATLQKRMALDLTPNNHPKRPSYLNNLGTVLEARFDQHGLLAELEDAIAQMRKAVELTPDGHPDKPGRLGNLGNALKKRFGRLGSLADLEEAIAQMQMAVDLTPGGHPDKARCLSNLGYAFEMRFDQFGSLVDLEEAILQKRIAVDLIPDGHSYKPRFLSNLGNALQKRFDKHGSLADLEDAIFQARQAVNLTPDGHPERPIFLSNLGNAVLKRFNRQGSSADLEEAILQIRKAVDLTLDGHPTKPGCLGNLGNMLEKRFDRNKSIEDLKEAILRKRRAIDLTPDDHPDKAHHLNDLGGTSERKFRLQGDSLDLDDSILYRQQAIHLLPSGHPYRAAYLYNLARVLRIRFESLGDQSDLHNALLAAQGSAESQAASSKLQLQGALSWAQCCTLASTSLLPAFERIIELLPRIAWLGLAVDDQYSLLAEVGSTARAAIAAAIAEQEDVKAVEWAEQGRSIVWQNLLSLRTPLDELWRQYPDLATRLQQLSHRLEHAPEAWYPMNGSRTSDMDSNQIATATERDNLIDEVRKKPGFESFMKAKSLDKLAPAARDGPVIFLNLAETRCDALVLLSDGGGMPYVLSMPLGRVTIEKTAKLSDKLVTLLTKSGVRARDVRKHRVKGMSDNKETIFEGILRVLWLDYVQPILDGLAYQVNLESPPRLWWCTTGPLAFLPLHAAGLYDTMEPGHKVSDYVISSYAPTLTSLLDESPPVSPVEHRILTLAISNTPGAPLPCTEEEVRTLQHLAANLPVVNIVNGEATGKRVLEELESNTWAHLACHGEQVGGKPMESGLILHDGKLKLSEIVKARLPNADFAFLSACQTAVGDGGIPEESAHLAAGMLFAGYRGVVATMWSIQDDIAPRVTKDFYQYMFRHGQPKREEAAYALHRAAKSLQESGVPFTSWVPFIHIGR